MLPPNRLTTLLTQAQLYQRQQCLLSRSSNPNHASLLYDLKSPQKRVSWNDPLNTLWIDFLWKIRFLESAAKLYQIIQKMLRFAVLTTPVQNWLPVPKIRRSSYGTSMGQARFRLTKFYLLGRLYVKDENQIWHKVNFEFYSKFQRGPK